MEKLLIGFLVFLIAGVAFIGIDYISGTTIQQEVQVIKKTYKPASTGVGIVSGNGSSGNSGTGVMLTSESEEYTLIVQLGDEVFSRSVEPVVYADAKPESRITIGIRYGGITGARY